MSTLFNTDTLLQLSHDRNTAVLVNDIAFHPVAGQGAPIEPATYAASAPRSLSHEAGPAFTERTVTRTVGPDGFHRVVEVGDAPLIDASVIVASVGDQARRDQNALWDCRDELDLPGIYLAVDTDETQQLATDVFNSQLKAIKGSDKNELMARAQTYLPIFLDSLKYGEPSSWTLPHSHADAWLRTAIDPETGEPVWAGGQLYESIISAGPTNITQLLRLSPNSLLYGFWLSIGAPIAHKQARSITSEIIGYQAKRMWRSATKGSPYQVTNRSQMAVNPLTGKIDLKDGLVDKPDPKKAPSHAGFGTIPTSWTNKTVTCVDILGTSTVSFAGLRAAVAQDRRLTAEQRDAAVAALAALGIYGRALTTANGFLRSGCDLIDVSNVWGIRRRGTSETELLEIPTSTEELLPIVRETLDHARELEVFGSREDRVKLMPSREGIALTAQAIIAQSLAKEAADSNE